MSEGVGEPPLPELEQPAWHSDHPLARVLVWTVLIPAIVFLVSNPVGWIVLFLLGLGGAFLFGFGGIL